MRLDVSLSISRRVSVLCVLVFFTHSATTEIYTLSLHDALPILAEARHGGRHHILGQVDQDGAGPAGGGQGEGRSEEHTSELQSRENLVCRLLLEKKKKQND